jgi:hypothetical protein
MAQIVLLLCWVEGAIQKQHAIGKGVREIRRGWVEDAFCLASRRPEAAETHAKRSADVVRGRFWIKLRRVDGKCGVQWAIDGLLSPLSDMAPGRRAGSCIFDGSLTMRLVKGERPIDDRTDLFRPLDLKDGKALDVPTWKFKDGFRLWRIFLENDAFITHNRLGICSMSTRQRGPHR